MPLPGHESCAVNRREKIASFGVAALVAAELGEARGGAQFPELGLLLPSDAQRFAKQLLGRLGMPLPQQQLAPVDLTPNAPCSVLDIG